MLYQVFGTNKPLIGMIHLPAMPGYPDHPGMEAVITKALRDLETLEAAGYHGALVENDNDQPHRIGVSPASAEAFMQVMQALLSAATIPIGMEIIYDMPQTLSVALSVGAQFVRFDVFVDSVETKWGVVPAQAADLMTVYKGTSGNKPLIMADVHVKHAQNLTDRSLVESAASTIDYGAHALIVTGSLTGIPPTIGDCVALKGAAGGIPIFIGSGLTHGNAASLLSVCDGAIVGSSIKKGEYIDLQSASELREIASHLK